MRISGAAGSLVEVFAHDGLGQRQLGVHHLKGQQGGAFRLRVQGLPAARRVQGACRVAGRQPHAARPSSRPRRPLPAGSGRRPAPAPPRWPPVFCRTHARRCVEWPIMAALRSSGGAIAISALQRVRGVVDAVQRNQDLQHIAGSPRATRAGPASRRGPPAAPTRRSAPARRCPRRAGTAPHRWSCARRPEPARSPAPGSPCCDVEIAQQQAGRTDLRPCAELTGGGAGLLSAGLSAPAPPGRIAAKRRRVRRWRARQLNRFIEP